MKKISFALLFNCVSFIVISLGLYSYFEYENSFSAARIRVMADLGFISSASLVDSIGMNVENLDKKVMSSDDLPGFSKIKTIQDNKYGYLIYESNAWKGYIFIITFKTFESKVDNFSVFALDRKNNTMLLPTKTKLDRDIMGMLQPLLDEILIKK